MTEQIHIGKLGTSERMLHSAGEDIPEGWVLLVEPRPSPPHKYACTSEGTWEEVLPTTEHAYHERICKYHEQVNGLLLAAIVYRLDGDEQKAQQSEQKALQRYREIKEAHPYRDDSGNGGNT